MNFVTYMDGDEKTPYGVLLTRHSVSCSVSIAKKHRQQWLDHLRHFAEVEVMFPTLRPEPVPVTFSSDQLADIVSDLGDEGYDWADPYLEELTYMCTKDPCGMGVVYLMGDKT